jgi:hypothetical protein
MPPQLTADAVVFWRFVCRHVTKPKFSSRRLRLVTSLIVGLRKMTTSSAYMEVLNLATLPFNLLSRPLSVAVSKSHVRGSMAKIKRRGERGSPCRSPLPCWIGSSAPPLSMTLDVEVDRSAVT